MEINVIFNNDNLLAVIKPQGIASVPGKIPDICSAVLDSFPHIAQVDGFHQSEGGLLNRLDNETGGILLFAQTNEAFEYYKNTTIHKYYYALTNRVPKWQEKSVNFPIAHHYSDKSRMIAITPEKETTLKYRGKPQLAQTNFRFIKEVDSLSLIEAEIENGKRHQIRVHLAAINLPIFGDKLYSKTKNATDYHKLFCYKVALKTLSGENIEIKYSPNELKNFI
jgi:23S rRNA-/tRNA-specific pseudouridylate synthase